MIVISESLKILLKLNFLIFHLVLNLLTHQLQQISSSLPVIESYIQLCNPVVSKHMTILHINLFQLHISVLTEWERKNITAFNRNLQTSTIYKHCATFVRAVTFHKISGTYKLRKTLLYFTVHTNRFSMLDYYWF